MIYMEIRNLAMTKQITYTLKSAIILLEAQSYFEVHMHSAHVLTHMPSVHAWRKRDSTKDDLAKKIKQKIACETVSTTKRQKK